MSDDISTTSGAAAAPRGLAVASLVTGLLGLVLVGVFFWTPAGPAFLWIGAVLGLAGLVLGNVAMRAGGKIEWDAENMKVTNNSDANKFLKRDYREGWNL